jgi:hypothetical protein
MTAHARRVTDPTTEQLRELLEGLFVEATREPRQPDRRPPSFAPLLRLAASRPHGVHALYHHLGRHLISLRLGACWWTDPSGHTHWVLQACLGRSRDGERAVCDLAQSSRGEGLIEFSHPLEWFHPEIASGWRTRAGVREFVVACRCGFAGTPESLGWAGPTCGPCHDREEDGLPPLGPDPREPVGVQPLAFHLAPDGRLLTIVPNGSGQRLQIWPVPWGRQPRWACGWRGEAHVAASLSGLIAIGGPDGGYTIRNPQRKATAEGSLVTGRLIDLAFAGTDGSILVAVVLPPEGPRLRAWPVTPAGELRAGYEVSLEDARPFAVTPDGARLLVPERGGIVVRDALNGTVVGQLALPRGHEGRTVVGLPDGSVVATSSTNERHPPVYPAPIPMHRWEGRGGRRPDVSCETHCTHFVAALDGRSLVCIEGEVVVRDAVTLEERGRFRPTCDRLLPSLGFTPDGRLVTLTDRGVTAWPWKELFG